MNSTLEWIGFLSHDTHHTFQPFKNWFYAAICSALVGLTGLIPVLLFPDENQQDSTRSNKIKNGENNNLITTKALENNEKVLNHEVKGLRFMLSFAVGGLLGDVFLHLLPEAMNNAQNHQDFNVIGLFVLFGLLVFTIVEKVLETSSEESADVNKGNGNKKSASGYLNLAANCIDNFNHGLAVGSAFLVSAKVGFVTTGCILLHEIPHEVGDFAILMKSGFSRREAAKAQLSTAFMGIAGSGLALALESVASGSGILGLMIVPFTCGGFLHIALVAVLPDLLDSSDFKDCFKVLSGILLGIGSMMLASFV